MQFQGFLIDDTSVFSRLKRARRNSVVSKCKCVKQPLLISLCYSCFLVSCGPLLVGGFCLVSLSALHSQIVCCLTLATQINWCYIFFKFCAAQLRFLAECMYFAFKRLSQNNFSFELLSVSEWEPLVPRRATCFAFCINEPFLGGVLFLKPWKRKRMIHWIVWWYVLLHRPGLF